MTAPAPARTYAHHQPITASGRLSDVVVTRTRQDYDWATATLHTGNQDWPVEVWYRIYKTVKDQLANDTWVTVAGRVHLYDGPPKIVAREVTATTIEWSTP